MSFAAAHAASDTRRPGVAALVSGARALVAAGALAAALSSCAHAPVEPPAMPPARRATPVVPATPPKPRPKPGYDGRVDSLSSVDASVLRGKKIVLDPGHGGYFTGCIGVGGLTEAEVNLSVALHLRELLAAAGAEVTLTRERDRDYLTPADSTLRSDLQKRVEIANAAHADLFVSIHHNADPGGLHDVNETQVYYQLGDEGPSYDLANDVMRSLARNLGIESVRLLPGNFYVVRGSEAPALLTESSYLTNPDVEARLRTDGARKLEAEALYLGVARFFARKVPVVTHLEWSAHGEQGSGLLDAPSAWIAGGDVTLTIRVQGVFDQADVRVDGVSARTQIRDAQVIARPWAPLAAGPHEALVSVRLAGEGSSRPLRVPFEVRKPKRSTFAATVPLAFGAPEAGAIPMRVTALDMDGLPRPETLAIRVHIDKPLAAHPRDTTVVLHDGVAWAYLYAPEPKKDTLPIAWTLTPPSAYGAPVHGKVTLTAPFARTGFALRMPEGRPLTDAPGTQGANPVCDAITRDGFLSAPSGTQFHAPQLHGFRAWGADSLFPPRYTAIAGGALWGKRVVLDPEGGGDDAAGTGRTGTRAATLNLDVARALASMLRAAGAEVALTRDGDAAISEVERVQIAEGFKADRYLRIGHAAAPPVIGHYFSSAAGSRWGQRLSQTAVALGLDSVRVADVAKYALTQASAVALYVSLARIDDSAAEARLLESGAARREAYALYIALAREFAPEAHWPLQMFDVRDGAGVAQPGAPVRLGGALVLASDAQGKVRYVATEPGPLEAAVSLPGTATRVVLLDSLGARIPSSSR